MNKTLLSLCHMFGPKDNSGQKASAACANSEAIINVALHCS